MTIDPDTQKKIRAAFFEDYLSAAVEEAKGVTRFAIRLPRAIGATLMRWENDSLGGFKMLGAGLLAGGAVVFLALLAPAAALGAVAAAAGLGLFGAYKINRAANAAFRRDMDSGALAARYNDEIAAPKKKPAPARDVVKTILPAAKAASAKTVSEDFTQAAKTAEVPPPVPAPAATPAQPPVAPKAGA